MARNPYLEAEQNFEATRILRELQQTMAATDAEEAREHERSERQRLERIARASEATAEHTRPRLARDEMTIREKSAFIAKHGSDAYLALPAHRRP